MRADIAAAVAAAALAGAAVAETLAPPPGGAGGPSVAPSRAFLAVPEASEGSLTNVVRLVRIDQGDLESLAQAEERWLDQAASSGTDKSWQPVAGGTGRWRRLPQLQVERLRRHHEEVALLQLSEDQQPEPRAKSSQSTLERSAGKATAQEAVIPLKQLSSQYVGPVGIGTQTFPEHCTPPQKGHALLVVDVSESATSEDTQQSQDKHGRTQTCRAKPQSTMQLIHDTGSTNLWLFSKECHDPPCVDKRRTVYDRTKSMSFVQLEDTSPTSITFGTGKIVGSFGKEDFHFPHYSVKGQQFGMIKNVEGAVFEQPGIHGLLGLSFRDMSANNATPLMDNMIQQGVLKKNSVAFYMSPDSPSANALFWGPVDPRFYSGKMRYFRVSDPYYWSVDLDRFSIGDETFLSAAAPAAPSSFLAVGAASSAGRRLTPKAIFDSGTTYFTAGDGLFDKIMDRLRSAPCGSMTKESHPDITFRLGDTSGNMADFVFDHNEYMVRSGDAGGAEECRPAFMKINVPEKHNGPSMLFGQTFNLKHLVEYDRGDGDSHHARVGVALARHGPEQEAALKAATSKQPSAFARAPGAVAVAAVAPGAVAAATPAAAAA